MYVIFIKKNMKISHLIFKNFELNLDKVKEEAGRIVIKAKSVEEKSQKLVDSNTQNPT